MLKILTWHDPGKNVRIIRLGHPYGPNVERGIFRTTNGGATWERVLFVNESTGGIQVELDPKNPSVAYGVLWEHQGLLSYTPNVVDGAISSTQPGDRSTEDESTSYTDVYGS